MSLFTLLTLLALLTLISSASLTLLGDGIDGNSRSKRKSRIRILSSPVINFLTLLPMLLLDEMDTVSSSSKYKMFLSLCDLVSGLSLDEDFTGRFGLFDVCESKDVLVCLKATDGGLFDDCFLLGQAEVLVEGSAAKGFLDLRVVMLALGVAWSGAGMDLVRLCGDSGVGRKSVLEEML